MLVKSSLRLLVIVGACSAAACARQHGRHRTRQVDASAALRDASEVFPDAAEEFDADDATSERDAPLDVTSAAVDAAGDASNQVDSGVDAGADAAPEASTEPYLAFTQNLRYPQVFELFAVRADRTNAIERLSPEPRRSELVVHSLRYVLEGKVLLAVTSREGGEPELYALYRGAAPERLGNRAQWVDIADNGTAIAVAADGEAPFVYRLGPTGTELLRFDPALPVRESSDDATLKVAPDGAHLLYQATENRLAVATLVGSHSGHVEYVQRAAAESFDDAYDGAWGNDGKHLVYRSWAAQLYVASPDALQKAVALGQPDNEQCGELEPVQHVSPLHVYVWCLHPKDLPAEDAGSVRIFDFAGQLLSRVDGVRSFDAYCGGRALIGYSGDKAALFAAQDDKLVRVDVALAGPVPYSMEPALSRDCTQAAYTTGSTVVQIDLAQSLAAGSLVQQQAVLSSTPVGRPRFSPGGRYLSVQADERLLLDVKDGLRVTRGISGDSVFSPDDAAIFRVRDDVATSTRQLERIELPDTSRVQPWLSGAGAPLALDEGARFLAFSAESERPAPAGSIAGLYEIDLTQGPAAAPLQRLDRPVAPAGGAWNLWFIAQPRAVAFEANLEERATTHLYARTLEPGATTVRQALGNGEASLGAWFSSAEGTTFAAMTSVQGKQYGWVAPFRLRAQDPQPEHTKFEVPLRSTWLGFGPERASITYQTYDVEPFAFGVIHSVDSGFTRVDLHTLAQQPLRIAPKTEHFSNLELAQRTGSIFYRVMQKDSRDTALYVLERGASSPKLVASGLFTHRLAPSEDWLVVELIADPKVLGVARRADGWTLTLVNKPNSASYVSDFIEYHSKEYVVFSDGSSYPAGFVLPRRPTNTVRTNDGSAVVYLSSENDTPAVMRAMPPFAAAVHVATLFGGASQWYLRSLSPRARYLVGEHDSDGPLGEPVVSYLFDLDGDAPPLRLPRAWRFVFDRSERYLALEDEDRNSLPTIVRLADRTIIPIAAPPAHDATMGVFGWVE